MYEAQVYITLKKTISDPQGLTVKHALEALGYKGLEEVRIGKFITVKIKTNNNIAAKEETEKMCRKLLANSIIEDYKIEIKEVK